MFDGHDIGVEGGWCLPPIYQMTRRILQTTFIVRPLIEYEPPISILRNLGLKTQLLFWGLSEYPFRRVSAGLSPLRTWSDSSMMADSRISPTSLATNLGKSSLEFSWKTEVLSVGIERQISFNVRASWNKGWFSLVRTRESRKQKTTSAKNVLRAITEQVKFKMSYFELLPLSRGPRGLFVK